MVTNINADHLEPREVRVWGRKRMVTGPRPGSAKICTGCGTVLIYGRGMKVRRATPKEIEAKVDTPEKQAALLAVRDEIERGSADSA